MKGHWMLYGANGYTGQLIAREAVKRGLRPILAGRNGPAIEQLAAELKLPHCVVNLEPQSLQDALVQQILVLNCAGPFSATAKPMIDACFATDTHYLDITGEIDVFQMAHEQAEIAKSHGIVLCPGVGFDVVPTDALAMILHRAMPEAKSLILAFEAGGGPSRGTARTAVEGISNGGKIRKDGELLDVPLAWRSISVPFATRPREAVSIPWGDVFTSGVSTGIPDCVVYMVMPEGQIRSMRRARSLASLLRFAPIRNFVRDVLLPPIAGPSTELRANTISRIWGAVCAEDGRALQAEMHAPNGYDLTVDASLGAVEHMLAYRGVGGYYTPGQLLGTEFALGLEGVSVIGPQALTSLDAGAD